MIRETRLYQTYWDFGRNIKLNTAYSTYNVYTVKNRKGYIWHLLTCSYDSTIVKAGFMALIHSIKYNDNLLSSYKHDLQMKITILNIHTLTNIMFWITYIYR